MSKNDLGTAMECRLEDLGVRVFQSPRAFMIFQSLDGELELFRRDDRAGARPSPGVFRY